MLKNKLGALAFAFVLAAFVTPLQAQQGGRGAGRGPNLDEQMAQLTEELDLTEDQAASVRVVLEMQAERRQELFAGGGGDREAMRAAMMEMREETDLQLKEILTDEQMGKYTELMAARRQRRGPPFSL